MECPTLFGIVWTVAFRGQCDTGGVVLVAGGLDIRLVVPAITADPEQFASMPLVGFGNRMTTGWGTLEEG
ncbi:hypothetical protein EB74_22630 [Mycobacterium sp. SWH-M5]|nr:hypothetical protein EB74_22630 [Mycobacterium sp. SWH-M5]